MRKLSLLLIVVVLVSCQKEIKFKGEEAEIQMVLNGSLIVGEPVEVNVSRSKSILEDPSNYIPVSNADVWLNNLTDDLSYELRHYGAGDYKNFDVVIEKGKQYEVVVEHSSYNTIIATQIIPFPTPINRIDTGWAIHMTEDYFDVDMNFTDDPNTEDYYEITMEGSYWNYVWDENTWEIIDSTLEYGPLYFQSFDPILGSKGFWGDRLMFSDEDLTSSTYTMSTSISYWDMPWGGSLKVSLNTVSKDYYLYFLSKETQRDKAIFSTGEPVPVYSNVSNAMGILGSFSTASDSLDLGY